MRYIVVATAVCNVYTKGVANTCPFSREGKKHITLRPLATNLTW